MRGVDFQFHAFDLLKQADHIKQIARLRIAFGAQHTHKTFRRFMDKSAEFLKADGRIDLGEGDFQIEESPQPTGKNSCELE